MPLNSRNSVFMIVTSLAICALSSVSISNAHAHSMRSSDEAGSPKGIEITSIAHSDMELLSKFRPGIISLAERQVQTDERMRRLMNFSKIQYTYCLWGMIPGALTDEESDFNACSHAYLASSLALLDHMESMPMASAEAVAIRQAIDVERAASPSFVLCKSSADLFYTDWLLVPRQTYATAGGVFGLLLLVGALPLFRASRRVSR
ncbi:hypothetical protein QYR00_24480 (plasmid) [Agrobacterium tumefaciens]|nr:hypothetical protein QYR00_24480 [Agrobacterium tumefaciens]